MSVCRHVSNLFNVSAIVRRAASQSSLVLNHNSNCRTFTTTSCCGLKKVQVSTVDNVTTVEGVYVKSNLKDGLLKIDNPNKLCPLCPSKLNMDVKYTDVLIISQFVRPDGCVLSRNVTGLCLKAQRRLATMVHRAQRAGLMPELRPDRHTGEKRTLLKSPHKWRQFNIFYKE